MQWKEQTLGTSGALHGAGSIWSVAKTDDGSIDMHSGVRIMGTCGGMQMDRTTKAIFKAYGVVYIPSVSTEGQHWEAQPSHGAQWIVPPPVQRKTNECHCQVEMTACFIVASGS